MASTIVLTIINLVTVIYMLIVEIKKPKQNAGLRYWLAGHFIRLFGVLVIVSGEHTNNYQTWLNLIYIGFSIQMLGFIVLNEGIYKFTNNKSKYKYINYLIPFVLASIGLVFKFTELFLILITITMLIYFIIHISIINFKTSNDTKNDYILYSLLQTVIVAGSALYITLKIIINFNNLEALISLNGSNPLLKLFTIVATFNALISVLSVETMPIFIETRKQRLFSFMVDYTDSINLILDLENESIYYANNDIAKVLGYRASSDLINKSLGTIFENEHECHFISGLISNKESFKTNLNLIKENNEVMNFDVAFRGIKIKDKRYCLVNFNETLIDQDTYKIMAYHDELTKLPNRRRIIEIFEEKRNINKEFYLVIIDIDNFKTFNDSYGHLFGDKVLKHVGNKLLKYNTNKDLVGRYGGDEFVLFLSGKDKNIGDVLIEIIKMFKEEVEIDNKKISIDMSLGFSHYPNDGEDLEELFEKADRNLYKDKKNNKEN